MKLTREKIEEKQNDDLLEINNQIYLLPNTTLWTPITCLLINFPHLPISEHHITCDPKTPKPIFPHNPLFMGLVFLKTFKRQTYMTIQELTITSTSNCATLWTNNAMVALTLKFWLKFHPCLFVCLFVGCSSFIPSTLENCFATLALSPKP